MAPGRLYRAQALAASAAVQSAPQTRWGDRTEELDAKFNFDAEHPAPCRGQLGLETRLASASPLFSTVPILFPERRGDAAEKKRGEGLRETRLMRVAMIPPSPSPPGYTSGDFPPLGVVFKFSSAISSVRSGSFRTSRVNRTAFSLRNSSWSLVSSTRQECHESGGIPSR